ncbi:unnamed protein product [Cunninghamella blakesleeana]
MTNQTSINISKQTSPIKQDIINSKQLLTNNFTSPNLDFSSYHQPPLNNTPPLTAAAAFQKQQSPVLSQEDQITAQLNHVSSLLNSPNELSNPQQQSINNLPSVTQEGGLHLDYIDKDVDADDHNNNKNKHRSDFDFQYSKSVQSPSSIQHDNDSPLEKNKSSIINNNNNNNNNNNQLSLKEDDHKSPSLTKTMPSSLLSKDEDEDEDEVRIDNNKINQEIVDNVGTIVGDDEQLDKQQPVDDSINILPISTSPQDGEKTDHDGGMNQGELQKEKKENVDSMISQSSHTDVSESKDDQDILSQYIVGDKLEKEPSVEIEVETSKSVSPGEIMDYEEPKKDIPSPSQDIEDKQHHDRHNSTLSIKSPPPSSTSTSTSSKHTKELVNSNKSSPIIQPLKDLKITDNDHHLSTNDSLIIDNKKEKNISLSPPQNTEILLRKNDDYVQNNNTMDDLIKNDINTSGAIVYKDTNISLPLQLDYDNDINIVNDNYPHRHLQQQQQQQPINEIVESEKAIIDRNKQIEEEDIYFDFDHDSAAGNNENDRMEEQNNEVENNNNNDNNEVENENNQVNDEENEQVEKEVEKDDNEDEDDDHNSLENEMNQYFHENMNMKQIEEKRNHLRKEIKPDLLKFFENEQLPDNVEDINMGALVRFLERNMTDMLESTAKNNLMNEILSAESAIIKVTTSFKNELPNLESRRLVDMFGLKLTHQLRTQFELYTELKQLELLYNKLKRQHNASRTKAQTVKIEHDKYTKKLKSRKTGLLKIQKAKKYFNEYETFFQDLQDALLE